MRPEVVAHRGASDEHPEHTLTAYATALEQGADALECDVRLTADGELVCLHDRTLRRTASHPGVVSAMELAALDELDYRAWHRRAIGARVQNAAGDADRGVLTLRRLLETMAAAKPPVRLVIETKHPTRYGGLVERRLVELLQEFGWHEPGSPVRVMSFSYLALRRLGQLAPGLPLVMLFEHPRQWPRLQRMGAAEWAAGPGIDTLRRHPSFARRLADSGRELHVWTVNTEAELRTCLALGVRAVITDRPGPMLDLLRPVAPPLP